MRELRLVAVSDDGTRLILRPEGDDATMALPVDERLHAAMRGDRARLGQLEIQMDSQVRPRDIQARIRGGESVESVAAAAAVPLDRVLRYAGPVLAEREYVAGRARRATVRRTGGDGSTPTLEDAVARWVTGIDVDPDLVQWDAWRRDDGRWQVSATWPDGADSEAARFAFDPAGRSVAPDDDQARAVAGERPPEPVSQPGPTRLSVVARARTDELPDSDPFDDLEDHPDLPAQVVIVTDRPVDLELTEVELTDVDSGGVDPADDEPTGPIPVPARRHRRGERRRPNGSGRLDDTTSERLRLTDIASRVEIDDQRDGVSPAPRVAEPAARSERVSSSRSRRPTVPSWDEIMFGRRRKPD
jgi:Protein of unknown function (DUF3071)